MNAYPDVIGLIDILSDSVSNDDQHHEQTKSEEFKKDMTTLQHHNLRRFMMERGYKDVVVYEDEDNQYGINFHVKNLSPTFHDYYLNMFMLSELENELEAIRHDILVISGYKICSLPISNKFDFLYGKRKLYLNVPKFIDLELSECDNMHECYERYESEDTHQPIPKIKKSPRSHVNIRYKGDERIKDIILDFRNNHDLKTTIGYINELNSCVEEIERELLDRKIEVQRMIKYIVDKYTIYRDKTIHDTKTYTIDEFLNYNHQNDSKQDETEIHVDKMLSPLSCA